MLLRTAIGAATAAVAVLAGVVADGDAAFPGANGRIVFQRGVPYGGGQSSLYLVNADGTGLVRLTRGFQHDAQPSWSPNGGRIAFESTRRGDTDVYVVAPDGSGLKELTFSRGFDGDPAWSSTGGALASRRRGTAGSTSTRSPRTGPARPGSRPRRATTPIPPGRRTDAGSRSRATARAAGRSGSWTRTAAARPS